MTTRAITDATRLTALQDCENKIQTGFRRGIEATCVIAKELGKIEEGELFTAAGYETFNEYLLERARISERTMRRIAEVSYTVEQFKESGLTLPDNESQIAELIRLESPGHRIKVWSELRNSDPEKRLAVEDVRRAVDNFKLPELKPAKAPIEVDMEDDSNGDEPAKPRKPQTQSQEGALSLTEKGEAALARIRKVIGDPEADAIEQGIKIMTEREIKGWADCDDDKMRDLRFYIMDQNWPLSKAISFSEKEVEDSTDVSELVMIARSRNGFANFPVKGATITVKIT